MYPYFETPKFCKLVQFVFSYAALVGAKHFLTSAKLNHNVEELFLDLSERMVSTSEGHQRKPSTRRNVVVVDNSDEPTTTPESNKTGCCG